MPSGQAGPVKSGVDEEPKQVWAVRSSPCVAAGFLARPCPGGGGGGRRSADPAELPPPPPSTRDPPYLSRPPSISARFIRLDLTPTL